MDRPPRARVGRHGGFAMDVLTGIGFFVVVAVVLIAGVYVMKPEK